jgi:CBS domain-containing protein
MNTLRTIMKNKESLEVWSVAPQQSVLEAVTLMARLGIGALLVMEGETLRGIVSERDYARKIILKGRRSEDTPVAEIMTAEVETATPTMTAQHCLGMMTAGHFRHLPVIEDGKVVGVVSIGDLVKCVIADQQVVIEELERYVTGG